MALKNLIQPLAGEYGMHNGQPQLKTHRELFSDFFTSLFGYSLSEVGWCLSSNRSDQLCHALRVAV